MILKGNERGNGRELAKHLMAGKENEHIELHDLRGFAADDLHGAMEESEAVSKGTRCKNYLFSLSLNPPQNENVRVETFEAAIGRIEGELGLEGQPRAIVFHEKEGRRHAHAVWSRIDGEQMKAINLPHYKRALNGIARDLYHEHGWEMPKGFKDRGERDPFSFTLEEWQQAKRTRQDPKAMKEMFRECWTSSDSRQTFENALKVRGYFLARGDKRGYVALDWRGEVYSLSRATGAKSKDLKARLGDPDTLQPIDQAKAYVAERMTPNLKAWAREAEAAALKQNLAAQFQREQMVQRHRYMRTQLRQQQEQRWLAEERKRAERTPKGLRGLWGWVTGKNRKIRKVNEAEISRCQQLDRAEKHETVQRQLAERRTLQRQIKAAKEKQQRSIEALNRDVAQAMALRRMPEGRPQPEQTRRRDREREPPRGQGYEPS